MPPKSYDKRKPTIIGPLNHSKHYEEGGALKTQHSLKIDAPTTHGKFGPDGESTRFLYDSQPSF